MDAVRTVDRQASFHSTILSSPVIVLHSRKSSIGAVAIDEEEEARRRARAARFGLPDSKAEVRAPLNGTAKGGETSWDGIGWDGTCPVLF